MDWVLMLIIFMILLSFGFVIYGVLFDQNQKKEKNLLTQVSDKILQDEIKLIATLKKDEGDTKLVLDLDDLVVKNKDFVDLKEAIHQIIVGQDWFINALLVALLTSNHVLVEWVPGLAKTKTLEVLTRLLDLDFQRVQFTPDMLPADITWTQIFNMKTQKFETQKWPVFTNILLADEINRTTPKVQSALLEAMQEKKVHIWAQEYELPDPFFVLATQNPIEQEWTYPLPEAQIDRFMLKVVVDYPSFEDELQILELLKKDYESLKPLMASKAILKAREEVSQVVVNDQIKRYIVALVRATRLPNEYVALGASPRWEIALMQGAQAVAFLQGKNEVGFEDIQRIYLYALRHRLILTPQADVDGINADDILKQILSIVPLNV